MAMSIANAVELMGTVGQALSGEARSKLLARLRKGPATVGSIAEDTGLAQPNTSHHLHKLAAAGLVERVKIGREVTYGLKTDTFDRVAKAASVLAAGKAIEAEVQAEAEAAEESESESD